jgi:hypothetical protein
VVDFQALIDSMGTIRNRGHDVSPKLPQPTRRSHPDASLLELLSLPVLMGGLSLLMWFSLPSHRDAHESYREQIIAARDKIQQLAATLPRDGRARSGYCAQALSPAPLRRDEADGLGNTEFVDPQDLEEMGVNAALAAEYQLYLSGRLQLMIYWLDWPPQTNQRMSRNRIERQIESPLGYRYLVLYGVRTVRATHRATDGRALGAARLDAFLFDRTGGQLLCELSFVEHVDPSFAGHRDSIDWKLNRQVHARFLSELSDLTGGVFTD